MSVAALVCLALAACGPGPGSAEEACPGGCGPDGVCEAASAECRCPEGWAGDGRNCQLVPESCGDGTLDPGAGEQCDDGNRAPGDGCDPGCLSEAVAHADLVVAAPGATGEGTGDPERAVNGVRGCGQGCGSEDVFSLGLSWEEHLVLAWSGRRVLNGPGPDFVVFENPFQYGSASQVFMDPVVVLLSRDGTDWVAMPHDYQAPEEGSYSPDPAHWAGFGGLTPVLLHAEDNPTDPFDRATSGGDAFDLDSLPEDGGEASAIRREGFRFLKLVAAAALENPDTGASFPRDPISDGPDIDGVYARWLVSD